MSLLLTSALLASATASVPTCSWDRPGVDPFTGSLVESVDRYTDIPADVRAALKQRMATRQYDDLVTIRRDAIAGRDTYAPEIRDMHFGAGRVCRSVTRTRWTPDHVERGLVYCASGHCLLVPTVCRNLSRIARLPSQAAAATPGSGVGSRGGAAPAALAAGGSDGPVSEAPGAPGSGGSAGPGGGLGGAAAATNTLVPVPAAQAVPVLFNVPTMAALPAAGSFAAPAGAATYPLGAALPPWPLSPLANPGFIPGVATAPVTVSSVPEAPAAMLWLLGAAGVAAQVRGRRSAQSGN